MTWFVVFCQGIPLHLQIDTYEDIANADAEPVHRSFCQIKVFRDKVNEYVVRPFSLLELFKCI